MTHPATFLLVHGSWHGPWCFGPLVTALSERGRTAVAVDLPSVGDDPAALGGYADDAATITEAAAAIDGPVVVVAHSYGGAATAEASFGAHVERLIYLGAFMPDTGRSYVSYLPPGPPPPYVGLRDDGTFVVPDGQAIGHFYADCTPDVAAWAESRLRPQSQQVMAPVVTQASWRSTPTTYVVLTEDRAIPPELQREFATSADSMAEFAASHSPFLSRTSDLADLLVEIAT